MASLFDRVTELANSPKTKQAIRDLTERGQKIANDPRTRAKLEDLRQRGQKLANDPEKWQIAPFIFHSKISANH